MFAAFIRFARSIAGDGGGELKPVVDSRYAEDHIVSLNFQPAAYTGFGGGAFKHDPMDRLTIPGVIQRIEEQTGGTLQLRGGGGSFDRYCSVAV